MQVTAWLFIFISSLPAAPSGLKYLGCTGQQCLIEFTVVNPASGCSVTLYTDSARSVIHPDSTVGGTACNRAGAVVDGGNVKFTFGARTGNRSLSIHTTYYFRITEGSNLDGVISTSGVAGGIYPDQPAYSATTWDRRAWPSFDFATRTQTVVDPMTGLKKALGTAPGDAFAQRYRSGDAGVGSWDEAQQVAGACTSLANANSNGSSYANCTGAASVWLPVPSDLPSSGYVASGSATAWNQLNPNRMNLDYLLIRVCGSADATARAAEDDSDKVAISLSQTPGGSAYHGGSFSVTLGDSDTCLMVPSAGPDPGFVGWGFTSPPVKTDIVPAIVQVSVASSTVTRVSGDYFQPQTWAVGSQIIIPGSASWATPCASDTCTITAYTSASEVTVSGVCATGCPSAANAVPKHLGVKVTRQGSTGSINLSLGYEVGMSPQVQIGEDATTNHCSTVSVSGGYICWFSFVPPLAEGTFYFYDPSALQMRPISITRYYANWSSNGLSTTGEIKPYFAGWDATNGNVFYGTLLYSGQVYLVKGDLSSCGPSYANWAGYRNYTANGYSPGTGGCVTYTNLSATSIHSQLTTAYSTYNSGFDISAFSIAQSDTTFSDGYFRIQYQTTGGYIRKTILALFDVNGTIVPNAIWDSWSKWPNRWGYEHGPPHALGSLTWWTLNRNVASGDAGQPLLGPWETGVVAVNRAGFGSPASWDANTAISNGEAYACPTGLAADLVAMGATGNKCIQLRLNSQPCSHTPGSATVYPGGQNEAQKYPCPTNAAWSSIQNLAVKDHLQDKANQYAEGMIIVSINVVSASQIEVWVVRGDGVWPSSGQAGNQYPDYRTITDTHSNGWTAVVTPPYNAITSVVFMYPDGTATIGNPNYGASHGVAVPGSSGRVNYVGLDINSSSRYATAWDVLATSFPFGPVALSTPHSPAFGGLANALNTAYVQLYTGADQWAASADRRAMTYHQRHLNGTVGGTDPIGNGLWSQTLALQGGTTGVYKVTDSASTIDAKRAPIQAFAGRYMLRDISSAATGNQITDATPYTVCYALRTNECRTGSSAGDRYVSVPYAELNGGVVLAGQHLRNVPAVSAPSVGAQIQQACIDRSDPDGRCQRFLGQSLTGAGRQWAFQGPRVMPDGKAFLETGTLMDGYQTQIILSHAPEPGGDAKNRTTFVPVEVRVGARSGMTHARVRFGYDGTFYCTARQEECLTDEALSPFAFAGDSLTPTPCDSGCIIKVPAISGRIINMRVEYYNGTWP